MIRRPETSVEHSLDGPYPFRTTVFMTERTWRVKEASLSRRTGFQSPVRGISFFLGLVLFTILLPYSAWAQEKDAELDRKVVRSFHGPGEQNKEGPTVKIGRELTRLYHEYERHRATKGAQPFSPQNDHLPVHGDEWVFVDAVARDHPEALRARLEELGLRAGTVVDRLVSGLIPIEALDEVAGLTELNEARPAMASTAIGATTSQGDVSLFADSLRDVSILKGDGVKIGVLSDSYDNHESIPDTRASDDIQSGDLPGAANPNGYSTPVEELNDEVEASDEGRAMMQIIHDVAPGADMAFHTAFQGLAGFAEGIQNLADVGSEVIVDDVFYFTEPFFQDGPISQAIESVVEEGVVYVTSAGNAGEEAYEAEFRNSGDQLWSFLSGNGELHDFAPGATTDTRQRLIVGAGQSLVVSLQWDDPFFSVSGVGADTDLDVYLLDDTTAVARGTNDNIGRDPVEVITYQNDSDQPIQLDLSIALAQGPEPDRLKYVIFQGGQVDEYRTASPAVSGHSKSADAISVAASAWFNTPRVPTGTGENPPLLNAFSSKGGTPILFDSNGNRQAPEVRQKPDLTGPDGVNTTFFGFDLPSQAPYSDADDAPNFFGTSAAAPHIAAVAALMREAQPGISPQTVRDLLKSAAVDITERYSISTGQTKDIPNGDGYDFYSGTGFVRAGEAILPLLPVQVTKLEGQQQGEREEVRLDWTTIKETKSRQFIVQYHPGERRQTPKAANWRRLGAVESLTSDGESTDTLQYEFASAVPSPGRYVFRLMHEQQDGSIQPVGPRIEINVPFEGAFELGGPQPNPTAGRAEIQLVVKEDQEVRVDLYDILGRRVRTVYDDQVSAERPVFQQINVRDLASGTYFLRAIGEEFDATRRLVRIR